MKKQSIAKTLFTSNLLISFGTLLGAFAIWTIQFLYDTQQQNAHSIRLYMDMQKGSLQSETRIWNNFILREKRTEEQRFHAGIKNWLSRQQAELQCQEPNPPLTQIQALDQLKASHAASPSHLFIHSDDGKILLDSLVDSLGRIAVLPDSIQRHLKMVHSDIRMHAAQNPQKLYTFRWWKQNQEGMEHLTMAYLRRCENQNFYFGLRFYQSDLDSVSRINILSHLAQSRPQSPKSLFIMKNASQILYKEGRVPDTDSLQKSLSAELGESGGFWVEADRLYYAMPLGIWNWQIGMGIGLDEIQKMSSEHQVALQKKMRRFTIAASIFLLCALFFALVISYTMKARMERNIRLITTAFGDSEKTLTPLNPDMIGLQEFERIAHSANQLMKARARIESEQERLLREMDERSNEFEHILYIASHDLRAPLVNMRGFTNELLQDWKPVDLVLSRSEPPSSDEWKKLQSQNQLIQESLDFIDKSTKRMDSLLNGLLAYSRLGRIQPQFSCVSVNAILRDVLNNLEFRIRESHARIIQGDLPECQADPLLLQQVFQNLLDNSIKYSREGTVPEIRITGYRKEKKVFYRIQDNGQGISRTNLQKVFDLFYRTEPAGSVKGDGLGLSLVKRMIRGMHGSIAIDSQEGSGSLFVLELPAAETPTETG